MNIAAYLPLRAAEQGDRPAVITAADGHTTSYAELERRSSAQAAGLRRIGIERGDRVCLFVPPGVELVSLTYALFKLGAVPVLADPGMGRARLLACLESMAPRGFIGVPRAHLARKLFPASFKSVEIPVTVGRRFLWGGATLRSLEAGGNAGFEPVQLEDEDPAAILFTSGSTGPPKGVLYTHGMFAAQVEALGRLYAFEPGEVDLACFPLFALFDVAFAMTSVFPVLDVSRPARCDPTKIHAAVVEYGATTTFGSPAIWRRVAPWCIDQGYKLEGLRRVLIAGAPVPTDLLNDLHRVLPIEGDVFTPYGATEALPVTSIAGRDVVPSLADAIHSGAGTCVGTPAPGIEVRLIEVEDGPLASFEEAREVPAGEYGEVCVRGAVVTHLYAEAPDETQLAKIQDADGGLWHRMGDVGRFDEEGRLWLGGRKSHRLETLLGMRLPVPVENVFNTHPRVHRSALVGIGPRGRELPVVVIEPLPGEYPRSEVMTEGFCMQLRTIGQKHAATRDIETFLFHEAFPVDVRHNAKIHREELKAWAEAKLQ